MLGVRAGEGHAAVVSGACFFCVLAGWFVSRPVRESMGTVEDEDVLRWLFIATLAGMTVLNPLFSWCVSRWRRSVFAPGMFVVFALNLWAFAGVIAEVRVDSGGTAWSRVFYVWSSVLNLFVVSVFWALMADLWGRERAKRLFGLIGLGGTLGALSGGLAARHAVQIIGVEGLLGIGGALMAGAALCAWWLTGLFRTTQSLPVGESPAPEELDAQGDAAVKRGGAWGGFFAIATSPALLAMCGYMVFFAATQTWAYFEQQRIVKTEFAGNVQARAEAFATMDVYVQGTTVLLQLFATGRLVRRLGIGGSLLTLPAVVLAGACALAASPTFSTLIAFQVARRAGDYALAKPAREAWYAGLSRMEKYKAKNFIDTFMYRGGDALGAWAFAGVKVASLGVAGAAALFAPLCVVWAGVAWCVPLLSARREARRAADSA